MRTRRQARLLERVGEHDAIGTSASDVDDEPADLTRDGPPQRKKRALTRASAPSKAKPLNKIKGRLSGVLSLPVEVFMEIIQYLTLPDVLSLSRSNKFFRRMLMTRSAATLAVWQTAVLNVPGLPPCPEDLCEPQYAALIYSKHCSMCGTGVVKAMDPYMNVRLCKGCIEIHVTHVDELDDPMGGALIHQSSITRMKASRNGMRTCLIRDVEEMRKWNDELINSTATPDEELRFKMEARFVEILSRVEYAKKMEEFLRDMADARAREIDQLKEQRRQDIQRRLEEAGWEEPDWTFPEFVARKWGLLVEGTHALTERAWQKLYPSLVPYLEKNRESHKARSKIVREGKRSRRMRRLLLRIRNSNNLFEVDEKAVVDDKSSPDSASASATTANNTTVNSPTASDYETDNVEDEPNGETETPNLPDLNVTPITVQAPFPPMVDLLKWPIISNLLKTDTDVDTMQTKFEELKDEIEAQIYSWRSMVENELVDILKDGLTNASSKASENGDQEMDSDFEVPQLQLKTKKLPVKGSFVERLTPATRLLLRADSVFRAADHTVAPMPMYFPELFHILQDRPNDYYGYDSQTLLDGYEQPRHGYTWNPSEVACYPEGVKVAKALLRDLGRVDAAQFELQSLGARFTCGLCGDKWPRTWNEIVHHYAEAIAQARIAGKAPASIKKRVKYNNAHLPGLDDQHKRKHKPTVILHSAEDIKALSSKYPSWECLVKCRPCEELGIDFHSPRNIMLKHVRSVHSIKPPKAENYKRACGSRMHATIGDPLYILSESTEDTDLEKVMDLRRTFSHSGTYVFWSYYGPHKSHPGWDRRHF